MNWDEWLEEYGPLLSEAWLVSMDVLQTHGEPPPRIRWVIRRPSHDLPEDQKDKIYYVKTYPHWIADPHKGKLYRSKSGLKQGMTAAKYDNQTYDSRNRRHISHSKELVAVPIMQTVIPLGGKDE